MNQTPHCCGRWRAPAGLALSQVVRAQESPATRSGGALIAGHIHSASLTLTQAGMGGDQPQQKPGAGG